MSEAVTQYLLNLSSSVLGAVIAFIGGRAWDVIPKSIAQYRLRQFWGKGVTRDDFAICYGALRDRRLDTRLQGDDVFRFRKLHADGTSQNIVGPSENILSAAEVRAASYLINTVSAHRTTPVPFVEDLSIYNDLRGTIVALGSSSSNEITRLILQQSNNRPLDFGQDDTSSFIIDKGTGQKFRSSPEKDYSIVLRVPNERCPGHFFFVCGGLGEAGTSGAVYYLVSNWVSLRKEFKNLKQHLALVVEVHQGSDASACRVFPPKVHRNWLRSLISHFRAE